MPNIIKLYFSLTKPGITFMQLVTVSIGFFMSCIGIEFNIYRYGFLLLGTLFCSSGACVFNHYIESDVDLKMNRTKQRP